MMRGRRDVMQKSSMKPKTYCSKCTQFNNNMNCCSGLSVRKRPQTGTSIIRSRLISFTNNVWIITSLDPLAPIILAVFKLASWTKSERRGEADEVRSQMAHCFAVFGWISKIHWNKQLTTRRTYQGKLLSFLSKRSSCRWNFSWRNF